MRRSSSGFTIIELVVALLIGSILTSIAMTQYGNAMARFSVRGARDTFIALVARARAGAIETGSTTRLFIDPSGDSVAVVRNGTVLESVYFDDELNVDIKSTEGSIRLCMNTRGYADTSCNSFSGTVKVEFWLNADSTSVRILPMGQVLF